MTKFEVVFNADIAPGIEAQLIKLDDKDYKHMLQLTCDDNKILLTFAEAAKFGLFVEKSEELVRFFS